MEVGLVILVIVFSYIYFLRDKVSYLNRQVEELKELKHKELVERINKYSEKRKTEFANEVKKTINGIKEIQYEINYILDGNYRRNNQDNMLVDGDELENAIRALFIEQKIISDKYKTLQEKADLVKKILESNINDFPFVSSVIADYETTKERVTIQYLRTKSHPAYSAAEIVSNIKKERKKGFEELYAYKWELAYLHDLLPWLEELECEPVKTITKYNELPSSNEDSVIKWVSPSEYKNLSTTERNQLALDRYIKSGKSKWQIGRDYERYIGYLYEIKGYKVKYFGIEQGLEDLGRDLICYRESDIHIVQCKCWSTKKEIHEKHINQLFGTTVMYYFSEINPNGSFTELYNYIKSGKLIPVFVTTTNYSLTAKKFAKSLKVLTMSVPLEDYPMIKCNVNRKTKEKIYHLPFDQQYDKCVICPADGEFYAKTVKEAEDKGFRRAMKWFGK